MPSVLDECIELGHTQVVRALVVHSPKCATHALLGAAATGRTGMALVLLQAGAAIDGSDPATGRTALHAAAAAGHGMTACALLTKGSVLDRRDGDGRTAVQLAVACGHRSTAALLLESASGEQVLQLCVPDE